MRLRQTPSQTVGPFFGFVLTGRQYGYGDGGIASERLADDLVPGERIRIVGRVLDGAGEPVPDAMIEIWQADGDGRYFDSADTGAHQRFHGFGRSGTGVDPQNRFVFHTIKPGPVGAAQAPHISVVVFMRGLLSHAYTRLYFSDEAEANARDSVLLAVPEDRRGTLIARREESSAATIYWFDVVMQGENETVFFDL